MQKIYKQIIKYHEDKLRKPITLEKKNEYLFIKTTPIIIDENKYLLDEYGVVYKDDTCAMIVAYWDKELKKYKFW